MSRVLPPLPLAVGALAALWLCGCGAEPPPGDCGDSSMAMIVLQGKTNDADTELRTCVDIHAASRVDATADSPGRDESYAVSAPGVIPWTQVTFREAVEACGRAGKFLCNAEELQAIAPIAGMALGNVQFDETAISALAPTSDQTHVDDRFERLNPYDMLIAGKTGQPPFPESTGSVAFWTDSPERDDKDRDPNIPLMMGRLEGDSAIGGVVVPAPVLDPSFEHPLLGFRCCINARMRSAFEALGQSPKYLRDEEPDVPIAEQ